jgi:uncharacterized protein (DUF305 family)
MISGFGRTVSAGLPLVTVLAMGSAVAGHPAPGPTSRLPRPPVQADTGRPRYAAADVRFMQGMIDHHAQAVAMVALVAARSSRQDMRLLARKIDVSQKDEIGMMRRWLTERHEEVPGLETGHERHDMMPGMLTPEEMAQLAKASGAEFDRLFLRGMIKHHEGALTMVAELFAANGAGQEPQLFSFASDVDADQRAEIRRMRAMLDALPPTPQ